MGETNQTHVARDSESVAWYPEPVKRTALKRKTGLKKRGKLNKMSKAALPMLRRTLQEDFNAYVRARDGRCEVFHSPAYRPEYGACSGPLNGSHIFAQLGYPSLRYDPENVIAKCASHHKHWWHQKTAESQVWIREHMGERHEALRLRAISFEHPWTDPAELNLLRDTLRREPDRYAEVYAQVTSGRGSAGLVV